MNQIATYRVAYSKKQQAGAALVVALILLVALTLMAIASMNTASLDLIMAGNEQYSSRAFVAAEAGIENAILAISTTTLDPKSLPPATTPAAVGSGSDKYTYTISAPDGGNVESSPPPGFSIGNFGLIRYRVTSTGSSERGAVAVNIQDVLVVSPGNNNTPECNSTLANCSTAAGAGLGD